MATTRISALTELTTPASADVLVINDDSAGSTKKIQLSNLIPDDAIDSEHYVAGSIDNEHLANDAVGIDELSATGTASSSTFLRGDNSWVVPTDTNTTYSVQDGELSEINFTSADHTKLNAIEASATADQTAGEILTLIEDGIDSVHYVDASIDNVHLADDAVGIEELSATGTASSSTFLRGDNTWAAGGGIASLLADTSPQLGGDLDLNSNDITGTGGINLTGTVETATLNLDGTAESSPAEGDIWYDSGKFYLGTSLSFTGVWSSGGNLGTATYKHTGAGTQSAGLSMGGTPGLPAISNVTEEYDGTSWTAGGNLGTGRDRLGGAGTQSAGLCMGGSPTPSDTNVLSNVTEEYDGTSWSSGGNLGTARAELAGAGTQSAGLCMGGHDGSYSNVTEEYDGTSWSSGGNLGTARSRLASAGTQSAGLCMGGYTGSNSNVTEEYDGTSWSSGGNLGTARRDFTGAGTQSAGLCMGGYVASSSSVTEEYDGTSWSAGGNLATARYRLAGAGTQTAGLCMGGTTGSVSTNTEEYTGDTWEELFTPSTGL